MVYDSYLLEFFVISVSLLFCDCLLSYVFATSSMLFRGDTTENFLPSIYIYLEYIIAVILFLALSIFIPVNLVLSYVVPFGRPTFFLGKNIKNRYGICSWYRCSDGITSWKKCRDIILSGKRCSDIILSGNRCSDRI